MKSAFWGGVRRTNERKIDANQTVEVPCASVASQRGAKRVESGCIENSILEQTNGKPMVDSGTGAGGYS